LLKEWHKDSNVDCFISKIEKPLYDEPNVMWAHAYVALSTKTNTFLVIKHLSSNNNFGTYYLEIKYPISIWDSRFNFEHMKKYSSMEQWGMPNLTHMCTFHVN
jgi:hypothetical protein